MTGRLMPLHLTAGCLWSKYGFMDGQPFEFEDRGPDHDDAPPHEDWILIRETMNSGQRHDLLDLLVRRHLVPAIADATGETPELVRIRSSHNPTRDARLGHGNDGAMPAGWTDIGTEVTPGQVLAAAGEIIARSG